MAFDKRKILQNALTYTQQGKWDRAIAEYHSILKADPRDLTVCNNLGDLYARAGKTAEAIEQYLKLGELYRADGLSVKAIAVYKKIAKLDPARTEAYLACADLYWEQGLVGEAKIQMATVLEHYGRSGETTKLIDAYRRLAQFDPTNSAVVARLADTMARGGMREAAAVEYGRAAQAAQAAGQAAEAKRLFQKARDLSPGALETNMVMAERLIGEGKASQALDVLKTLTTDEPGNVKAWRLLGETQASLGRAPEAIVALERAVALGVPEGEVARLLGLALLRSAREADAVALCRRVTDTRVAEGDPDAGIAYCRDLLAESPQSVELHAHLASLLEGLGRAEEARAALQALAALHEAANRSDAAVETYRRLLILDPSDATANDRLMALEPPAPVATEPPPVPVPDETVPASAEPVESPPAEEIDASLSSLEELGLSLGSEDAALLLEESSEPLPETIPDPSAVPADAGDTGETAVEDEMLQGTDWLTQELHAIDLEQTAPDGPPAGTEWGPRKPSLEVEDISAVLEGTPLSGIGGGTASDPDARRRRSRPRSCRSSTFRSSSFRTVLRTGALPCWTFRPRNRRWERSPVQKTICRRVAWPSNWPKPTCIKNTDWKKKRATVFWKPFAFPRRT